MLNGAAMKGAPGRTSFAGRRAAVAPGVCRQYWQRLLERAAVVGEAVAGGGVLSKDDAVTFAGQVVRIDHIIIPLPHASGLSAAAGFRELARAFITAAQPELREALGAAMAAAARCCLTLIALDLARMQADQSRRFGGD